MHWVMEQPFVIFDDMRPGGGFRLYERPLREIVAWSTDDVRPALDAIRIAVANGHHVAGYMAYDAAYALEPKLWPSARQGEGPLLWFGIFDGFTTPEKPPLLDGAGGWTSRPAPRISRSD